MVTIGVMKKGDEVVFVSTEFVGVKRKNGEVDLIPILQCETGLRVDAENIVRIGYGDNVVTGKTDAGVEIVNF